MLRVVLAVMLFFLFAPVILADSPDTESQLQITYSSVYTLPYTFEPIPIPTVGPTQRLTVTFGLEEINLVGTVVTTTFALIDQYEILGIMLVILLAIMVLRWLFKFVTGMPARGEKFNASMAIDEYYELQRQGLAQNFDDGEMLEDALADSRVRQQRIRNLFRLLRR